MKKASIAGLILLSVALTGCTSNQNELPENTSRTSVSKTASSAETSATTVDQKASSIEGISLSAADAIKAYQEAYPATSVTSLDLEKTLGIYYYEVKGRDDAVEYEVKINAKTGELTKEREEKLDADEQGGAERKNEELSLDGLLSIEKAAAIATQAVGKGEVTEWSLERELTTTYWELKVMDGRSETSVKLDAKTGEVLETEIDD